MFLDKKAQQYRVYSTNVYRESIDYLHQGVPDIRNPFDVEKLVVLLNTPRAGSSFLYRVLAETGCFFTMPGEHTPHYKMCGFAPPFNDFKSDVIPDNFDFTQNKEKFRELFNYMSIDLIDNDVIPLEGNQDSFTASTFARRFSLQWPDLNICFYDLIKIAKTVIEIQAKNLPNHNRASEQLYLYFVKEMELYTQKQFMHCFYDNNIFTKDASCFGDQPPNPNYLLEEAPYILPTSGQPMLFKDNISKPVLLKASIDSFKSKLLEYCFPNADIKYIHLTRNPASQISALLSGWQSERFHTHNLNYLDSFEIVDPEAPDRHYDKWWKFELPANYHELTQATTSLDEIVKQQWLETSTHILTFIEDKETKVLKVRYEDLIANEDLFMSTLKSIQNFLGCNFESKSIKFKSLPPIMSTTPPQKNKWRRREKLILDIINDEQLINVARTLGYNANQLDSMEWC